LSKKKNKPMLFIIAGVAGSGKSTVARELARICRFCYLDADDYHSVEARSLMAAGIPLDEEMRMPWIQTIFRHLQQLAAEGQDCVLAFPGLKKVHRECLRATGFDVTWIFLEGEKHLIHERLDSRKDHFLRADLLESQLRSLERPVNESDVQFINASASLPDVLNQVLIAVRQKLSRCHPETPHPRGNDES
jgi:gluconokinase